MKKFARRCSVTGELMNEGWVWYGGAFYAKYEKDAVNEIKNDIKEGRMDEEIEFSGIGKEEILQMSNEDILEWAYDYSEGEFYFTEWTEEDYEFID